MNDLSYLREHKGFGDYNHVQIDFCKYQPMGCIYGGKIFIIKNEEQYEQMKQLVINSFEYKSQAENKYDFYNLKTVLNENFWQNNITSNQPNKELTK